MTTSTRSTFLLTGAALSWGTVSISVKWLHGHGLTDTLAIGFYRLLFAALPLFAMSAVAIGRRTFIPKRTDLVWMLGMGASIAAFQACSFGAIVRVGVTAAVLIGLCIAPVIVALVSTLLSEALTSRTIGSGLLAIIGTLLLVGQPHSAAALDPLGLTLAFGGAASYAAVTLFGRALAQRCHPLQGVAYAMTMGGLLLLPFVWGDRLVLNVEPSVWSILIYLGLVPTALAYAALVAGMRHASATIAAVITVLEPLSASLLAWIFFDERIGAFGFVGAALLMLAIVLLTTAPARPVSTLRPAQTDGR